MEKKPRNIIILHLCNTNTNHIIYGFWDMECNRHNFLSFRAIFCPFIALTTRNIKILKKLKKTPGNIITLHLCTTNDNHMMYGSWDMECNRQNILSFWAIFCPFISLTTWKIKILKKWKKDLEISYITILQKCTKNHNHMLYCSWDKARDRCNFYFPFWTNFWTIWTGLFLFSFCFVC